MPLRKLLICAIDNVSKPKHRRLVCLKPPPKKTLYWRSIGEELNKVEAPAKRCIDQSNGPPPVSTSTNPMIAGVTVTNGTASNTSDWLFDTGGSITIIGQDMAVGLGIDLAHPATAVDVIGIGSLQRTFYGYNVSSLIVPMTGGD